MSSAMHFNYVHYNSRFAVYNLYKNKQSVSLACNILRTYCPTIFHARCPSLDGLTYIYLTSISGCIRFACIYKSTYIQNEYQRRKWSKFFLNGHMVNLLIHFRWHWQYFIHTHIHAFHITHNWVVCLQFVYTYIYLE